MKTAWPNRCKPLGTMIVIAILLILTLPLGSMVVFKVFSGSSAIALGISRLELVGTFPDAPRPDFTIQDWLNHRFQDSASKWFSRYFGARGLFVKLGNQVNYSPFDTSYMNNQSIIIGKQSQLYEAPYINDYCKLVRPMPLELVEARVKKIAETQDRLGKHGIAFVLLITPSKAAIYPEFIPDIFCSSPKPTNRDYENFVPLLDQYKINYIDGHTITLAAKAREPAPVFTQGGTHWNYLGAYYTVERLLTMIEALTSQSIGRLSLQHLEIDHKPSVKEDKDLADLLNLISPPYNYLVPHPTIVRKGGAQDLGKAVFVGGSFIWTILDILNPTHIFQVMDAYYYYKVFFKSYPDKTSRQIDVSQIDWNKDIFTSQVLVLEINESNFSGEYIPVFLSDILRHLRASSHD